MSDAYARLKANMPEAIALGAVYMAMLKLPTTALWRVQNQAAFASVRGRLADLLGMEEQEVQDQFERDAARLA